MKVSENYFSRDTIRTPLPALSGERDTPIAQEQNQPSIKDASSLTWKGVLSYTISNFQSDKFIDVDFMTQSSCQVFKYEQIKPFLIKR